MVKTIHFFRITPSNYNWFRLVHYLSIKSYLVNVPESTVVLHFDKYPDDSHWFHILMEEYGYSGRILKSRSQFKCKSFIKFKDKCNNPAHLVDQLAATTLYYEGGMVSDLDMICLDDISDLFFPDDDKLHIESELDYYGRHMTALGIGLMSAPSHCEVLLKYLNEREKYTSSAEWGEFSTELMYKLYLDDPDKFEIIPQKVVDPYGPQRECLQDLFLHNRQLSPMTKMIHLSESQSWDSYLKNMTVEHIMTVDTTFTKAVRRIIPYEAWDGKYDLIGLY